MGLSADELDLLSSSVKWEAFLSTDQWGEASFASLKSVPAVVQPVQQAIGNTDDNDRQQGTVVYSVDLITDAVGIKARDRITVGTLTMYATTVSTVIDEDGTELIHRIHAETIQRG